MAWFVVGLLVPWLTAYLLVGRCLANSRGGGGFLLRASLAVGIGLGLSSCTYFLWLMSCGAPGNAYRIIESLCFAGGCLFLLVGGRIRPRRADVPLGAADKRVSGLGGGQSHFPCGKIGTVPKLFLGHPLAALAPRSHGRWHRLLGYAFGTALVFGFLGVAGYYFVEPLGEWDAWAFWNQRARFLFRSGDAWQQAFSPAFAQVDYPLLIPATNARCWTYLGRDPGWVPWLVGCLLTFATLGTLVSGVGRLRSRSQGLLAGMVLLGTVAFLRWGAAQYADVPLAFFFLATVLLLAMYDAGDQPQRGLLLLAGLTAGWAAWTKNEGLLFVIVILLSRCLVGWRRGGGRRLVGDLAACGAGLLPIMGVVIVFRMRLVPDAGDNLLLAQAWHDALPRILDASRYLAIAMGWASNAFRVAKPLAIVLPICFLLLGRPSDRQRRSVGLPAALGVFCLMLAGYSCVYLISPYDLDWHLRTSLDRLLTQLWPLGILIFFLSRATPEQLLDEARRPVVPCETSATGLAADSRQAKPRTASGAIGSRCPHHYSNPRRNSTLSRMFSSEP